MQSELKPCPFCGCADIRINIHRSTVAPHYGATAYSIGCYQCGGSVPSRYDRSLLISFWNTRASDAEITRLTEALRAAEEREKGLREVAIKLHGALAAHTCEGCPRCPGDCAGANPPMMDCPTQRAIEAYRAFDAALKGPSHDA